MSAEGLHGYPVDDPDPGPRAIAVGSWVAAGAVIFFAFAFVFAFLYLRSWNSNGRWNAHDDALSMPISAALVVMATVACLVMWIGARRFAREHDDGPLRRFGWLAAVLLLAMAVSRLVMLATMGFQPTSGGYASVAVSWTLAMVGLDLALAYWAATVVQGARHAEPAGGTEAPRRSHVVQSALGCGLVLSVVAVIEVIAFWMLGVLR
jgi:magnesium-transporting ATPase (P-type)